MEHVKIRRDYFKTLISYIGTKSDKINEIFELFHNKTSKEVPKVRDQVVFTLTPNNLY